MKGSEKSRQSLLDGTDERDQTWQCNNKKLPYTPFDRHIERVV